MIHAETRLPMFWRFELGILSLDFGIDLLSSDVRRVTGKPCFMLTFLREGGTATPDGTEKHRPDAYSYQVYKVLETASMISDRELDQRHGTDLDQ